MDMLEDYLRAVSRLLPKDKREDIVAELRDEIMTRVEAKEEELGRSLTPDETEQLLRDFGHPIVVAARYRDEPQYAVGPALYPFWIFAIRLVVMIQIAVSALVFIGRVVGGGNVASAFGSAIGSGITGVATLIGFATVAAWLIERKTIKIDYLDTWRVQDLRFLDFTPGDWGDIRDWFRSGGSAPSWGRQPDGQRWTLRRSAISRGIGAIVGAVFVLLWWTGVISFDLKAIDPARLPFLDFGRLAAVDWPALKAIVYWPVLAYLGVVVAFGAATLAQPRAVRLHGLIDIGLGTAILAGVAWVWTSSPVAPLIGLVSAQDLFARVHTMITQPMPLPVTTIAMLAMLFTALGAAGRILYGLWEALTGLPRKRSGC